MHDLIPQIKTPAADPLKKLTKANECIIAAKRLPPPDMLFDEFWREGELALLFGPQATGKSVLAVQIADAIARGKVIDGFQMTTKRPRVLLVDLKLSLRQFLTRYSAEDGSQKSYKFSENLYRERPPSRERLCEWLHETVLANRISVVVIDDIAELRHTYDGTRETLLLMRELKKLKDELDISVLVIAGTREPGRGVSVSEPDMQRSRVLCDAADSVFALGASQCGSGDRYLIQTRSRSACPFWTASNAPVCRMGRTGDGLLSFTFDERFSPEIDEDLRLLICNVKSMHERGVSYRMIGEHFGFSKSKAERLCKKWTPALERHCENGIEAADNTADDDQNEGIEEQFIDDDESDDDLPEEEYQGEFTDRYLASLGIRPLWKEKWEAEKKGISTDEDEDENKDEDEDEVEVEDEELEISAGSVAVVPAEFEIRDPMSFLKRSLDRNDREIFVESEDDRGNPIVWYHRNPQGKLFRLRRTTTGSISELVDGPRCPLSVKF